MMDWITNNWEMVLLAFMILEKVIKMSPTKADDILLDMVLKPIFNRIKPK
tara:strand:- start:462 stop:611 length:150 start_codon:yes stop_codon:yes gene_type:complete